MKSTSGSEADDRRVFLLCCSCGLKSEKRSSHRIASHEWHSSSLLTTEMLHRIASPHSPSIASSTQCIASRHISCHRTLNSSQSILLFQFNAIASPLYPPAGAKPHAADLPVLRLLRLLRVLRLLRLLFLPWSIGAQIGFQNEAKFKTIVKSEKVALQDRLGAVLGRSWAPPTSKIVLWPTRRSFFQKSHLFTKSHSEAQLGHQKCRKRPQDGTPRRLQIDPGGPKSAPR